MLRRFLGFLLLMGLGCSFVPHPVQAKVIEDKAQIAPDRYEELSLRWNDFTCIYQVEAGDNLADLARRFNADLGLVAAMNALEEDAPLTPGQLLVLPREKKGI